jgi:ATP-dependent DNA helicase DinG
MLLRAADLLSENGAISRRLEGYEVRPQQLEMAAAVERALEGRGRLLVEAGTGVGKSLAYLIPAIGRIVEHQERVAPPADPGVHVDGADGDRLLARSHV